MEQKINIELDIEEINILIEALSNLPFKKVYKIIEKLHLQANNQINKKAISE